LISTAVIPYLYDEQAIAATKNPQLKLLFQLCKFAILDKGIGQCSNRRNAELIVFCSVLADEDELQWYIPAAILPSELQGMLNVINEFLKTPFHLDGKKATSLLSKKRRRHRRAPSAESQENAEVEDDESRTRRKEKKKREKEQYKSAQFIGDSDEEYGDMHEFLEKEKKLRNRVALAGAAVASQAVRPLGMRAHGMKKRKRGKRSTSPKQSMSKGKVLELSDSSNSDGKKERIGSGSEDVDGSDDDNFVTSEILHISSSSGNALTPSHHSAGAESPLVSPSLPNSLLPKLSTRTRQLVVLSDDED